VAGVATRPERLARAKRVEAKSLRAGAEFTLPSTVTVACPTRGFRDAVARQAAVGGSATAVIVAEAARLLRKYPAFNAYHDDGTMRVYESVNVGFAVDAGRGLKVPVVRDADRKDIAAIAAEMRDLVVAYLDDALTVESLAGGTFTVTDLSGEGVAAFHPLISRGQSAILGVCAEVSLPGAAAGWFNLVLGFDHQLSEGRTAARFLNELRERLAHYESTVVRGDRAGAEEPRCARCQAGYRELAANGHALIQAVGADGSVRLLCKLCFEGWT
jgi:pyruvate/2-oxoglutarate dehydrogenase complex dihydrolipoamide acyltransferase (E2) component